MVIPRISSVASRGLHVRISGLPVVTSTVCSKWADFFRSFVITVHPSSRIVTPGTPTFTMGSMAKTMPGRSFGLLPGVR